MCFLGAKPIKKKQKEILFVRTMRMSYCEGFKKMFYLSPQHSYRVNPLKLCVWDAAASPYDSTFEVCSWGKGLSWFPISYQCCSDRPKVVRLELNRNTVIKPPTEKPFAVTERQHVVIKKQNKTKKSLNSNTCRGSLVESFFAKN